MQKEVQLLRKKSLTVTIKKLNETFPYFKFCAGTNLSFKVRSYDAFRMQSILDLKNIEFSKS